jgi:prolyl 4-hydroxylase
MKSRLFLVFPLVSTVLNVLVACWLIHRTSSELIPALQEASQVGLCGIDGAACNEDDSISVTADFQNPAPTKASDDPYLKKMPDYDFYAYVRKDISSFYQEEWGSRDEHTPAFKGQAGKFVNMSPDRLDLYWDSGRGTGGDYIVAIAPFQSGGTATHPGHMFYFARHDKPDEPLCRFKVVTGISVYYYDPFTQGNETDPARCVTSESTRSVDTLDVRQKALYDAQVTNVEFAKAYKEFTGGSEWLSMYPKSPPNHHMWAADYYGQEHHVQSRETQFVELPPPQDLNRLSAEDMMREDPNDIPLKEYRTKEMVMNITLLVASVEPRIFEIPHFISDLEADHLLTIATGMNFHRSTTGLHVGDRQGDHVASSRTSTNSWVGRSSSPIVDSIIRRIADTLLVDEALLRHRRDGERPDIPSKAPLNEDFQVVHYDVGQEYTAHHDFSFPHNTNPESPSRSINVLLYLNDEGLEGGETSFPRWRNGHTNGAVNVKPEKGKAAIFYMVNPDGNLDDLTQHAALPVRQGEKYMSNLWIWDPVRL